MMIAASLIGMFLASGGGSTAAQAVAGDAAPLLAAWKRATGGSAWDRIRSLEIVSDGAQGGLHGPQREWRDVLLGHYRASFRRPPLAGADGFDGHEVWTADATARVWVLGDRDSRETALNAAFVVALAYWYPERFPGAAARVVTPPGAIDFDVVSITPAGSHPFEIWLDRATHLAARVIDIGDESRREVAFEDYRRVNGLLLPFAVGTSDGNADKAVVIRVTRYRLNRSLPDSLFRIPRPPRDFRLRAGRTSTTVPFTLVNGHVHLPVYVNGKGPFDGLLDTGGQATVRPDPAAATGIRSVGRFEQHSSSGVFEPSYGRAATLAIGDAVIDGPLVSVFQQDNAQIIVGHEVFQRFSVRIDPTERTVTLSLPEALKPGANAIALPFRFHQRLPEVDARVDGIAGAFGIDSGQNSALDLNDPFVVEHQLVDRFRAEIPATAVGVVG